MRIKGLALASLILLLGACSDPTATPTTVSTTSTSAVATTDTVIAETTTSTTIGETTTTEASVPLIRVENGAKTEGLDILSVRVGEAVVLDVEADISDEIHVHGYDLHFDVVPGTLTRVDFVADSTGIFEVELEAAALKLVEIEVTP